MSTSYNLDVAVDCIIHIVDGIRCTICDRIDEGRSRYACGHTACSECVVTAQSCLLCITPPVTDDIFVDKPLTRRAKHVAELLSAFQNTFHLDVLRRHRLSEQLKLEKELFPQCIQAPQTYYNKRRSSKSIKGSHSYCILPGEVIEPSKMESSRNFVQEWLENSEVGLTKFQPRQALSDLKINSPRLIKSPIKKRADLILDKVRGSEIQQSSKKSRRRSYKTALRITKSQSQLDKYLKTTGTGRNAKEVQREFEHHEKLRSHRKNYKDECGIVINDEPIIIEDSQSQVVDKDRQAWLAVLKACDNEGDRLSQETITTLNECPVICDSISLKQSEKQSVNQEYETRSVSKNRVHIPFYKKSSFLTPFEVSYKKDTSGSEAVEYKANKVSITVETHTLVTTIQLSRCQKPNIVNKSSKSVQTDVAEDVGEIEGKKQNNKRDMATEMQGTDCELNNLNEVYTTDIYNSQDLFTGAVDKNAAENVVPAENKNYLVNESGSDSEHEHSSLLVVTADVHQSRESELQRGILAEIHETKATSATKRPTKRGHSPVSSNSSNKENRNPNARKKQNDKKRKKRKD